MVRQAEAGASAWQAGNDERFGPLPLLRIVTGADRDLVRAARGGCRERW